MRGSFPDVAILVLLSRAGAGSRAAVLLRCGTLKSVSVRVTIGLHETAFTDTDQLKSRRTDNRRNAGEQADGPPPLLPPCMWKRVDLTGRSSRPGARSDLDGCSALSELLTRSGARD
jgi:hypothetical protein